MADNAATGQEPDASNPQQQQNDEGLREKVGDDAYAIIQELRQEAADSRVKLRDYEKLGDVETLEQASRLYQATQTDYGLKQLVKEASQELGISEEKVAQLWADDVEAGRSLSGTEDPKPNEEPGQEPNLDELERRITEKVQKPIQEFTEQQLLEKKRTAANEALSGLKVEDPSDQYDVLSYANKYVTDKSTPEQIADAIKKGYEDWSGRIEQYGELAVSKYLEEKEKDDDAPEGLSGGSPAVGEDAPPPKSVAEATQRLKKRLGL